MAAFRSEIINFTCVQGGLTISFSLTLKVGLSPLIIKIKSKHNILD